MKKVIHLVLVPILSGVQNVMLQILDSIDSDDYDITVASAPNGPLVDEVLKRGWKHLAVESLVREINPVLDYKASVQLYNILKKGKYDIIHTHSSKTGIMGRIVGYLAKIPHRLHTIHGYPFHKYQNPLLYWGYVFAELIAGRFSSHVISVNYEDSVLANKLLKIPKNKIHFIPNGEMAKDIPLEIASGERITVGCLARFWKQKNMVSTVKTAILCCNNNPKIDFIFVGDGEDLAECKQLVQDAKLENRIELPGWSADKEFLLSKFDVFILYSLWEGLPLAILEAMSYGLPIIASNIKGNRELVSEQNGWLIDVTQNESLLNCLLKLTESEKLLKGKGLASWELVKNKYSASRFSKSYKKLYREL